MINLPLNELVKRTGCRYMLVTVVAQRARQLQADPEKLGDRKPVSAATQELLEDKLDLEFTPEYYRK